MDRVTRDARRLWLTTLLGSFALFCTAPKLEAKPAENQPSAGEIASAKKWFQEAAALELRGDWAGAKQKLLAAIAIKETPGLYFHLAHCEVKLGELVLALEHYERARALIAAGSSAPDVEELLGPAQEEALDRAPRLTLLVKNGTEGARVEIDGREVGAAPLPEPVLLDPGRHRVVVRPPNGPEVVVEVTLEERQARTLEVSLPSPRAKLAPKAPESAAPARDDEPEHTSVGIGAREIVLIGEGTLAAAGLAVGIGFSIARGSARDRIEGAQQGVDEVSGGGASGCQGPDPAPACAELRAALDDHDRASGLATAGFITAAVGLTSGVLTFVLWPSDSSERAVSARPLPGGAALMFQSRF